MICNKIILLELQQIVKIDCIHQNDDYTISRLILNLAIMQIRLLEKNDVLAWKKLRLESLLNFQDNYLLSYEEESLKTLDQWVKMIEKNKIYGLFINNELCSVVCLGAEKALKRKHISNIWGVYTKPELQTKGYTKKLLTYALAQAQNDHEIFNLKCHTTNHVAYHFFQNMGFKTYGIELKAGCYHGQYYDVYLMSIDFSMKGRK